MKVAIMMLLHASLTTSFVMPEITPIKSTNNTQGRRTNTNSLFTSFQRNQLKKLAAVKLKTTDYWQTTYMHSRLCQ